MINVRIAFEQCRESVSRLRAQRSIVTHGLQVFLYHWKESLELFSHRATFPGITVLNVVITALDEVFVWVSTLGKD